MTTDPTTILREAIVGAANRSPDGWSPPSPDEIADEVFATRIPQACQTCKGEGVIYDLRCDNCGGSASLPLGMMCNNHLAKPTPCPDCPTIGTLLLWGWNVAKAEAEDRGDGDAPYVTVHYPVSTKFAVNLLTELREVPT